MSFTWAGVPSRSMPLHGGTPGSKVCMIASAPAWGVPSGQGAMLFICAVAYSGSSAMAATASRPIHSRAKARRRS
jgi:hypothetical protein